MLSRFRVFALALAFALPASARAEDALRIVLVIDTNASKVGGEDRIMRPGMNANQKHLQDVINEVYNSNLDFFKTRMFLDVIKDDKVSPKAIRDFLSNMKIDPSDRVLFYYCGHGAWDKKLGHFLATSGGDLTRNDIRNILNNRGPRAAFIITDCCSSYASFTPPERRRPAKWKVFKKLFYETDGVVEFTAATEGEFGWISTEGGFFTRSMTKYLCEPAENIRFDGEDGPVTWDDFFGRVKALTKQTFANAKADAPEGSDIKNSAAQTPYAFRLGGWPTQFTRKLVFENKSQHKVCIWVQFYDRDYSTEQWGWYPGGGKTLRYEIDPGEKITPLYNGLPIEAHTFTYRGASLSNPNVTWSDGKQVKQAAPKEGYTGRLGTFTMTLNP